MGKIGYKKPPKSTKAKSAKGGRNKKGSISIKSALKRVLESGAVDVDQFAKSMFLNGMKGNSGIAKLIMEYLEGKVKEEIDITSKEAPKEIKITFE